MGRHAAVVVVGKGAADCISGVVVLGLKRAEEKSDTLCSTDFYFFLQVVSGSLGQILFEAPIFWRHSSEELFAPPMAGPVLNVLLTHGSSTRPLYPCANHLKERRYVLYTCPTLVLLKISVKCLCQAALQPIL